MTDSLGLLPHRHMRLVLPIAPGPALFGILAASSCFYVVIMRLSSPLIHEVLSQIQIAPFACRFPKLNQSQLYLFMPGITPQLSLFGAKDTVYVIGVTADHIQKMTLTRGLKMRNGRFHQVSGTVQLMAIAQICPPLFRFYCREPTVDIPIGSLELGEFGNDFFKLCFQLGIRVRGQAVGSRLHPLGYIRVPENMMCGAITRFVLRVDPRNASRLFADARIGSAA